MRIKITALGLVTFLLALCGGCSRAPEQAKGPEVTIDRSRLELFAPLPNVVASDANPITEEKIALGRMLFYEPRLSKSQKISCNTCHKLNNYGVDGEPTSDGHKGQKGTRNSPTVYNAAGHFA